MKMWRFFNILRRHLFLLIYNDLYIDFSLFHYSLNENAPSLNTVYYKIVYVVKLTQFLYPQNFYNIRLQSSIKDNTKEKNAIHNKFSTRMIK